MHLIVTIKDLNSIPRVIKTQEFVEIVPSFDEDNELVFKIQHDCDCTMDCTDCHDTGCGCCEITDGTCEGNHECNCEVAADECDDVENHREVVALRNVVVSIMELNFPMNVYPLPHQMVSTIFVHGNEKELT